MKQKNDWLSAVAQVSPGWAWQYRFLFSRSGVAVLLTVLVLSLGARAFAQPAGPNILTPAQVVVFDQLVMAAKKVDPVFIQAQLTEGQKRAELSPLGTVTGNLSAGAGVSLGNSGGFDQVQPGYRLSASAGVDLAALARTFTKSNKAQLDALTNSTSAAGRDLRVRVLQAYTAYLSAVRGAGVASDALEVSTAALNQQQARALAGAATGVEVLRAAQSKNSADAALYDANLRLAVSKQQLAAITGLTLAELDRVLSGVKPRP